MTSEFVKLRDAFENWINHLWHTQGVKDTVQTVETAGIEVAKAALISGAAAGMAAKANGGDIHAVEVAVSKGALGAGETVGLQVGTETAAKIVETVTAALHEPAAAPAPPVPQSAPADAAVGETAAEAPAV